MRSIADPRPDRRDAGAAFIAGIVDPGRSALVFRTAVVVAHPDDETIGCASLLPRISDLTIVHVTDGAPRNGGDAELRGFGSPEAYADARRHELEAAMSLAGVAAERLVSLGWPDQAASLHMAEIATDLARRLSGTEIVLTHAYEGGHPDHDAATLCVHAACRLIERFQAPPVIVEFPLYRASAGDWQIQSFSLDRLADAGLLLELSGHERLRKQAMLTAYQTQHEVLRRFPSDSERFRLAPNYDFANLPNNGDLLYEQQQWGMTGARWLHLAGSALAELGLGTRP